MDIRDGKLLFEGKRVVRDVIPGEEMALTLNDVSWYEDWEADGCERGAT